MLILCDQTEQNNKLMHECKYLKFFQGNDLKWTKL